MNRLVFDHVSLRYQDHADSSRLLGDIEDISFAVEGDRVVAVVGKSGSGRDTILRLIAGYIKPDCGRVLWNDLLVDGASPERGVVFHQSALFPWLSVAENIEFGLKLKNMPKTARKQRIAEYLDLLKLTRLASTPMYKVTDYHDMIFVSFARCLVMEPALVLIGDEPLNELNDRFWLRLHKLLEAYWNKTRSMIVLATSNVDDALLMASEIHVLRGRPGRIARSFQSDFNEKAKVDGLESVRASRDFRDACREIVSLII